MPLGFSYRRWSSPEQIKGDTLRRQTQATADWCARNKVQLEESIRMVDAGVSAFKGKNLEDPDVHALAGFREYVRGGRVPAGSYLIVESFDRLSRDHWRKALPPLLELINAGVKLVQLVPEQVIDLDSDEWSVMGLIMTLARGRNESVTKSNRVGSAWAEKQKNAASKVVTRKLPGWIRYADGKLVLDAAGTNTIRRIYKLAREGLGVGAIAKKLNADRVPVLGRTTFKGRAVVWNETVVYHLLTTEATVGRYQPCRGRGSERTPIGDPIPNYFPPVVSSDEWYAVQGILKSRTKRGSGRRGRHVNLFSGLLVDARDGGSMTYKHLSTRSSSIIPVGAKQGRGTMWTSFPAVQFESGVLRKLAEVRVADVQGDNADARKVESIAGKLAALDDLIRAWTAKMDNAAIIDTVAGKLAELNTRRKAIAEELADAQRKASDPLSESWGEARTLAALLEKDNSDEMRMKMRAALRRSVESIRVLILPGSGPQGRAALRLAAAQVWFRGAERCRSYIVACEPNRGNRRASTEGDVWVESFAEAGAPATLDLRNAKDAKAMEKLLAALDVKAERTACTLTEDSSGPG